MRLLSKRLVLGVIIASLVLIVSVLSAQEAGERLYTIQAGDTLQAIANANNVSLQALLVRNAIIDPNRIQRGQQIIIPGNAVTLPTSHIVQPGERLTDIAIRYNTTVEALREVNNLGTNLIFVGEILRLPATGGPVNFPITYRIEAGETLRQIATRYGITWELLAAYNNIANPNLIQVGATIVIPPQGTTIPTPMPVVTTPVPVVVAPAPAAPQPLTYTVQLGDYPERIAERFGVTPQSLMAYNNITNSRTLQVGDVLRIPPTGGVVRPVTVPAQAAPVTNITGNRYIVRAGDTMFSIAAASGVNVYAIAQANGILNLNMIYTGQNLVIPR